MEKNINFVVWRNYEVIKTFRCKGKVLKNKMVPFKNKTICFDCGDVEFNITLEQLFGCISYPIDTIKEIKGDIDIDAFVDVEKVGYGILKVGINGFVTPSVDDDVDDCFMQAMSAMGWVSIRNDIDLPMLLNIFNAYKRRYKNIREKIRNKNVLDVYDAFYEVVDAPIMEWHKRFRKGFNA